MPTNDTPRAPLSANTNAYAMNSEESLDLAKARLILQNAQHVLIGAGAGLSTAAGLTYSGTRFATYFEPYIKRYGMSDMYSAGFYPFPTDADRWAYWAQHVWVNRFLPGATDLYKSIYAWASKRDYFVLTTNVDAQFELAGFDTNRIFATQGDYGTMQCHKGCHQKIYSNQKAVEAIRADIGAVDGVPERTTITDTTLIPHCPVCGGPMDVHLRSDASFVEDEDWHNANQRYTDFVTQLITHHSESSSSPADSSSTHAPSTCVLLELGVGWNTPVWIRFPFERISQITGVPLIRINFDPATADTSHIAQGIGLAGDISSIWDELTK